MNTSIISDTVTINKEYELLYGFLKDLNNFKKIVGEIILIDVISTETTLSFSVPSLININVTFNENDSSEFTQIILNGDGKPVPYNIIINIQTINSISSKVYIEMQLDISQSKKLITNIISNPLKQLFDTLLFNLNELPNLN